MSESQSVSQSVISTGIYFVGMVVDVTKAILVKIVSLITNLKLIL